MIQSGTIDSLFKALAAAKAELPAIRKDGWNPFTKSKYATLEHLLPVCDPILAKHGLFLVHLIGTGADGPEVTALLVMPQSAEYIGSAAVFPAAKKDSQAWGSAITYGRRYTYVSILGLAMTEGDDDGVAASAANGANASKVNGEQIGTLILSIQSAGADIAKVCAYFGVAKLEDLPAEKYDAAIEALLEFKKRAKKK